MIKMNIFDIDEQIAINHATAHELLSNYKKADLLKRIDFVRVTIEDGQIYKLYDDLKEKINSLTDNEWEEIKAFLPYKTPYSEDDV